MSAAGNSRVLWTGLGAAAGFALLAAATSWAKAAPFDCHAIANECYTQSFRSAGDAGFRPLAWRGYKPPLLTSWLLVAVPVAALLLARRYLRAAALWAFP